MIHAARRGQETHVGREDHRRRREVQFGDVERLVQEIGRKQLVDGANAWLGGGLLRSWLATTHLHVGHALCDASNAGRRRGAVGVGGREALGAGRRRAVWLLRSRVAGGSRLCVLGGIASVARLEGLRGAKLASSWQLAADSSIAARSHVECPGGVVSLLLLGTGGFCAWGAGGGRRRGGRVLVGLGIVGLLVRDLALAVVVGCRHGGRREDTSVGVRSTGLDCEGGGIAVSCKSEGRERGLVASHDGRVGGGEVEMWSEGGGERVQATPEWSLDADT